MYFSITFHARQKYNDYAMQLLNIIGMGMEKNKNSSE